MDHTLLPCRGYDDYISCDEGNYFGEYDLSDHANFNLLPQYPECGRSYVQPGTISSRIVGGENAVLGEFPWIVRVRIFISAQYNVCGASLVSKRYVLSSAHCYVFPTTPAIKIQLIFGDYFQDNDRDCVNGRCAPPTIERYATHLILDAKFNTVSMFKDIALIRLKDEVNFNDFVRPICLPFPCIFKNETFNTVSMTIAGWGFTAPNEFSNPLQKLTSDVIDSATCKTVMGPLGIQIWPFEQCFNVSKNMSTCAGDSGGPVMLLARRSSKCKCAKKGREFPLGALHYVHYLMGVVSYALVRCFSPSKLYPPRVQFTVRPFLKWILDKMKP